MTDAVKMMSCGLFRHNSLCATICECVTQLNFSSKHASGGTEDEQEGGPECQRVPVHPGGRALSGPWGIRPLFPRAQGLLERPPDEDEGLWHQHPHDVWEQRLWMCFVSPEWHECLTSCVFAGTCRGVCTSRREGFSTSTHSWI